MTGISDVDATFNFIRNAPEEPQVLACFAGEGEVLIDGRWKSLSVGKAYVTPAGVPHAYHAVAGKPWRLCWILYHPVPQCPIKIAAPQLIRLDPRPVQAIIRNLYHETAHAADPKFIRTWLDLLQMHIARVLRESGSGDLLWSIWNAVAADLQRDWTTSDLAAIAGVSGEHLRRMCHKHVGCSAIEYITAMRIRHARALLLSSPSTIDTIAAAVGYGNRFSFSTAFQRVVGKSPAAFRKTGR